MDSKTYMGDRARLVNLPRGGYLALTPAGAIQFGTPPETIKDTMVLPSSVPRIFVLPDRTFHWRRGINHADLEFPIYFNFFIKQKKTYVCCTREQAIRVKRALQEAVFGPEDFTIGDDMAPRSPIGHHSLALPVLDRVMVSIRPRIPRAISSG